MEHNTLQPVILDNSSRRSKILIFFIVIILIIVAVFWGFRFSGLLTKKSLLPETMQTSKQTNTKMPSSQQSLAGDIVFPADSGVINVKDYGAKGDGVADDTVAIQRAISENLGKKEKGLTAIIYFPTGTYLVSNTIVPKNNSTAEGGWLPYLTLQGQHRDKAIIKLKDNASGYGNKGSSKAVLFTASSQPSSAVVFNWIEKGEGNEAFNNNIFDLTVDTGKGNPGAIGIDYLANNSGSLRNVKIVSGDGQGFAGLSLIRKSPGPAFIKNVTIEGFDYGIKSEPVTYISTFEHITLRNQKVAGIHNMQHVLAIRDLQSENSSPTVPAIIQDGKSGFITLIDSNLRGTSSQEAIDNRQGEVFLKNIKTVGYTSALKNKGTAIPGTSINEYYSFQDIPQYKYSLFDTPKKSLNLEIQETPEVPWDPIDKWINVKDYGADGSGRKDFDNTPAVQKAIDDAARLGKTTLYFPKGLYAFGDTIKIRGNIRRVHLMFSSFGIVNSPANKFGDGRPFVAVEEGSHPVVVIEGGGRRFNTGATVMPKTTIKHISSKTLVLKNMGGKYENLPGSGPVFFEDMQGSGSVFRSTKVWARHLDPESNAPQQKPEDRDAGTKLVNEGSDLWILGLKTEGPTVIIETKNAGRTEVLGGQIYPVGPVPSDMPAFINRESSHSLSFVIAAFNPLASHNIIIEETQNGETRQLKRNQVPARGQGTMVPFFAGYSRK